jgi:histidyl-tRNA synthetase
MAKLVNISGFPEWLPEQKLVEDRIAATVRGIYAGFGFTPIETPSVELLSTLSSKGEIDKEIYTIRRLQADAAEEAELALHYDLTVPFARYVAQHYAELDFPFKRSSCRNPGVANVRKRALPGVYQFDIDTICRETVPPSADAEILTTLNRAFQAMGLVAMLLRLTTEKSCLGFMRRLASAKSSVVQQWWP